MTQKPALRGEVGARALRVQLVSGVEVGTDMGERGCAGRLGGWVGVVVVLNWRTGSAWD